MVRGGKDSERNHFKRELFPLSTCIRITSTPLNENPTSSNGLQKSMKFYEIQDRLILKTGQKVLNNKKREVHFFKC